MYEFREVRQGLLDMQTMFSLLSLKSKIVEKPNAVPLVTTPLDSTISFKDVTFSYEPTQAPILNKLSFDVPSGKKVAIVGGSGSGKSTIGKNQCDLELPYGYFLSAATLPSLRRRLGNNQHQ